MAAGILLCDGNHIIYKLPPKDLYQLLSVCHSHVLLIEVNIYYSNCYNIGLGEQEEVIVSFLHRGYIERIKTNIMVCLDYFGGVKVDGGCSWLLCLSWYIFIFPLLVTVYTIKYTYYILCMVH